MHRQWRIDGIVPALALRVACLVLAGWSMVMAPYALAAGSFRSLDIQHSGERYVIDATLYAPVGLGVAWDVLTDFERMNRFAPNVRESRIVNRDGNRLTIAQQGIVRFGPVNFTYTTERLVVLWPQQSVHSLQTRGTMRHVESVTTLATDGDGTLIRYHVEIVPSIFVAPAFSPAFLEHEIQEQFEAIVAEMVRRRLRG